MRCIGCGSTAVSERGERTTQGYRRFRWPRRLYPGRFYLNRVLWRESWRFDEQTLIYRQPCWLTRRWIGKEIERGPSI
jgi:hypothetical protein